MNPSSESEHPQRHAPPAAVGTADATPPNKWWEALQCLVASRLALVKIETKEAVGGVMKSIILLFVAVICLLFMWGLALAGAIGAIASVSGWAWWWVTLAAAALHLLVAAVCIGVAKSSRETFSVTRSEFQKDREWLKSLQKNGKSSV
jgi:uncharacterized membrane protein YqjE